MRSQTTYLGLAAVVVFGALAGCSSTSTKAADVSDKVRASLDQAGYKEVSVSQDRDKAVVTLGGHVASDTDKSQAESLTRAIAGPQVVANQIAVVPPGAESDARKVNSDLDKAIEHNLSAALITEKLQDSVKYAVKNHVVTLTGDVRSQAIRARAEKVAAAVANVEQVVNELQVSGQRATSTK